MYTFSTAIVTKIRKTTVTVFFCTSLSLWNEKKLRSQTPQILPDCSYLASTSIPWSQAPTKVVLNLFRKDFLCSVPHRLRMILFKKPSLNEWHPIHKIPIWNVTFLRLFFFYIWKRFEKPRTYSNKIYTKTYWEFWHPNPSLTPTFAWYILHPPTHTHTHKQLWQKA